MNEEKKVGIPESITINGVTYLVKDTPELQQFIQEVAKVEKSKLYTQFENLKAQITNLGRVKVGNENSINVDEIVEKLKDTFVTKDDFKVALPDVLREVVKPVLVATEQNRKNELDEFREKLIQENIATCIPELVKGSSKEELLQSLQESIRIRASYPTPSTAGIDPNKHVKDPLIEKQQREMADAGKPTPTPAPAPQPTPAIPTPPAAPRRPSPEVSGPTEVKQMSMSEFAKRRDELQAQLEAVYGSGSL